MNTGRYVNWQEIMYLHAVWDKLNLEFADMQKLLPLTRQKRRLKFWRRCFKFSVWNSQRRNANAASSGRGN
jgi:hypothetical protein